MPGQEDRQDPGRVPSSCLVAVLLAALLLLAALTFPCVPHLERPTLGEGEILELLKSDRREDRRRALVSLPGGDLSDLVLVEVGRCLGGRDDSLKSEASRFLARAVVSREGRLPAEVQRALIEAVKGRPDPDFSGVEAILLSLRAGDAAAVGLLEGKADQEGPERKVLWLACLHRMTGEKKYRDRLEGLARRSGSSGSACAKLALQNLKKFENRPWGWVDGGASGP